MTHRERDLIIRATRIDVASLANDPGVKKILAFPCQIFTSLRAICSDTTLSTWMTEFLGDTLGGPEAVSAAAAWFKGYMYKAKHDMI